MAESEFTFQENGVDPNHQTFTDSVQGPPGLIYKTGHSFYSDPGTFLWDQTAVNTGITIGLGLLIFFIIVQQLFFLGDEVRKLLDKIFTKTEMGRSLSNAQELTSLTNSVMDAIIKFGNKNNEKRNEEKET